MADVGKPNLKSEISNLKSDTFDQFTRRVMSGEARGGVATLLRVATSAAEPFYSLAASARNRLFDIGAFRSVRLPRPVISVGNITTGGTGKTPLVRWLAAQLHDHGKRVAILSRGYKATPGTLGDEQLMLDRLLNGPGASNKVSIAANPDRVAAATALLRDRPETDLFILDDGFQHRRVRRELDLVVISATSPFGYGRVLPRGMLREPLRGLSRASAFVVTHADAADPAALERIEREVRRHNPDAPLYRAAHVQSALRRDGGEVVPLDALRERAWFAFCGIGDPLAFLNQLQSAGGRRAGFHAFPDHYNYTPDDVATLKRDAAAAGADVLVTTEKDWAKLSRLPVARETDGAVPIWRADVELQFMADDAARLWDQVLRVASPTAASWPDEGYGRAGRSAPG
ncbi:MAG TPA: tetraacyldisaccharide 4'-kinase [Tepidisphaeraceae bacterium]|nr:tetraacyldisaccharide 4'-kinase [Tepidisphaeraceae bacterium]